MSKVGIGIVTYNRPEYFKQCYLRVKQYLWDQVDGIWMYNDGSKEKYPDRMEGWGDKKVHWFDVHENHGVAHAKNFLLQKMLDAGMDYLFLIEDDILVKDPRAITEYIRNGEEMGYEHMMFAHHGDANTPAAEMLAYKDTDTEYWKQCIGAYTYFTRNILETARKIDTKNGYPYPGMFDENFHNAWEHVEHSQRLSVTGLCGMFGLFVDIVGSKNYLEEIPGSIEGSSIRQNAEWLENRMEGLKYWEKKQGVAPPIELILSEKDKEKMKGKNAHTR